MPTLADGTVAVIVLNLVQEFLDRSSTKFTDESAPGFKHFNTGDLLTFTCRVAAVCTNMETSFLNL